MKMPTDLTRIFNPAGRIDRAAFFGIAVSLVAVKVALDAVLSHLLLDVPWQATFYWAPLPRLHIGSGSSTIVIAFGLLALPFAWVGAALSIRRLRDAGLSPWFVVLFAIPAVNVVLFVALATVPTAPEPRRPREPRR